jgi:hypothetical protein
VPLKAGDGAVPLVFIAEHETSVEHEHVDGACVCVSE